MSDRNTQLFVLVTLSMGVLALLMLLSVPVTLTNKSDIISAYNMLLNGSYCHLRAFNSQLGQ